MGLSHRSAASYVWAIEGAVRCHHGQFSRPNLGGLQEDRYSETYRPSVTGIFFLPVFDVDPAKFFSIQILLRTSRDHWSREESKNSQRHEDRNRDYDVS